MASIETPKRAAVAARPPSPPTKRIAGLTMPPTIARIPCDSKPYLLDVPTASSACIFGVVETIGARIRRLREAKGWSRPELGRQMKAIGLGVSGEMVRLYEEDKNRPGVDARKALAAVFNLSEAYIEFGKQDVARQSAAEYRTVSEWALDVARRFDDLSPDCQEHVSHQIDLLKTAAAANGGARDRAAKHDLVIKAGAVQSTELKKRRRS